MLVFGIFSRLASIGSIIVMLVATFVYRDYMVTYFNYFGEFAMLAIFGSYVFSLDRLRDGKKVIAEKAKQWEMFIIRATYGISIIYPAVTIKLLHPVIILEIVAKYHMTDIHWLFPPDPLLISLGTGLTQIIVGLMIIAGFQTRFNSLITFFFYVLSILFFLFRHGIRPNKCFTADQNRGSNAGASSVTIQNIPIYFVALNKFFTSVAERTRLKICTSSIRPLNG